MSSDDEFTVQVTGGNLNLKIAPESEEDWKRAASLVELAAESNDVEIGSSDADSFEDAAELFESQVSDLRREFDSMQTQLETVMDNFVSDEELESKLNSFEERVQDGSSASLDVDEKLSAMWDMIDDLEDKLDEVVQESNIEDAGTAETGESGEQDEEEGSLADAGQSGEDTADDEGRSLSEFRSRSVSDRNELIFELIKRHQPVHGLSELGEYVFGHEVEAGSKEYGELGNRVSDIKERIERESEGTSTVYYVDGDRPDKDEGARRIDNIDSGDITGMSLVCTECKNAEGVFDTYSGAKTHRREEGHDSWVIAAIPNDDWKNGKTVENIVERRTA